MHLLLVQPHLLSVMDSLREFGERFTQVESERDQLRRELGEAKSKLLTQLLLSF
jgi:hypothetical protein